MPMSSAWPDSHRSFISQAPPFAVIRGSSISGRLLLLSLLSRIRLCASGDDEYGASVRVGFQPPGGLNVTLAGDQS